MNLADVTAIVTGASSGLGRCFAQELLRAGATVAGGDVDTAGLEELARTEAEHSSRLFVRELDVSDEESVTEFVEDVTGRFGSVNVLVNNAGVLHDGLLIKREVGWVRKLPLSQWSKVIDVDLTGQFLMAREVAAHIVENEVGNGLIVNVSSVARAGNPGQSNYAAAKAGLDADTRTWALELAEYDIRVAGIAPGFFDTPMFQKLGEENVSRMVASVPLKRAGHPFEAWLALRFIIECDYFTGRTLEVDGGVTFG